MSHWRSNPSHLEIVNPVVAGSVHARQVRRRDTIHTQSLAVLIHGDAALAGQGVNMELFNMSQGPRLQDWRQPAYRGEQSGRFHHLESARRTLHLVLHRSGQDGQRTGVPCEWRRPGSRYPDGAARLRVPQNIPSRRGNRSGVLSPPTVTTKRTNRPPHSR